jgi:hypothetical protein
MFRAVERAFANEALTQEIAKVILHLVTVAAVGVMREVLCGDDAKLAEAREGSDFGLAEAIAAFAIIERAASVFESDIGTGEFGRGSRLRGRFTGTAAIAIEVRL